MITEDQLDDFGHVKVGAKFESPIGDLYAAKGDGCVGCVGQIGASELACSDLPPCSRRIYVLEDVYMLMRIKGQT